MSEENFIHDIKRLKCELDLASDTMTSLVRPEDVVLFLGSSKAGKSTLINFMLGHELEAVAIKKYEITIQKNVENGPKIGAGSNSETTLPSRWENACRLPGLVVWDAPGLFDNRGSLQAITNAYYIYELFRNVRSMKIVLVVDFGDVIKHSIKEFIAVLHITEELFQSEMHNCFSMIALVFTKVPNTFNNFEIDVEFICGMLEDKILNNNIINVSPVMRKFVQHLIENPKQIGLFKVPCVGIINNDIDCGASTAILGADHVLAETLKKITCPCLDAESRDFLHKVQKYLNDNESFKDLLDVMNEVFQKRLNKCEKSDAGEKLKNDLSILLRDVKRSIDPNTDIGQKIRIIELIDPCIKEKIHNDDLHQKIELMQFVDHLLNFEKNKELNIHLINFLEKIALKIETEIAKLQMKLGQISANEFRKTVETLNMNHDRQKESLRKDLERLRDKNTQLETKLESCKRMYSTLFY